MVLKYDYSNRFLWFRLVSPFTKRSKKKPDNRKWHITRYENGQPEMAGSGLFKLVFLILKKKRNHPSRPARLVLTTNYIVQADFAFYKKSRKVEKAKPAKLASFRLVSPFTLKVKKRMIPPCFPFYKKVKKNK